VNTILRTTALILLALVPIGLYVIFVGVFSRAIARWRTRVLRPLLLMLLLAPGFLAGHGFAILPAGAAVYFAYAAGRIHHDQAWFNVFIWLLYAFLGFLLEWWLARRRMKKVWLQESLAQEAERLERQRERLSNTGK
jgi:hypothetical protein